MPLNTLALLVLGLSNPFHVERVDVVAAEPGTFINYDVPTTGAYGTLVGARFVEQVKVVWRTRWPHVTIGTSLRSQSVAWEQPFRQGSGFEWSVGLSTRLALPTGAWGDVAYRRGHFRLGVGLSAVSGATWEHPSWTSWRLLPTLALGVGRRPPAAN